MGMRRALLLLFVVASAASGQDPNVFPGSRVRIIPMERFEPRRAGRVVSLSSDSAVVRFEPVPEFELRSDVLEIAKSRLEVRTSLVRHTSKGALIGASLLATAGGIIGSTAGGDICEGNAYYGPQSCHKDRSTVGPFFLIGALAGAWGGAFVGHFVTSETWVRVRR